MDKLDFLLPDFINVIDIILVAILLYYVYKLVKGTAAINILIGIVIIYLIWKLTDLFNLNILSNLLGQFISVGVFALIVVFQQEIRKFLLMLGSNNLTNNKLYFKYINIFKPSREISQMDIDEFLKSCNKLVKSKTGALFIIERNNSLDFIKNTGDNLYLEISSPIIESIFYKNSPLHDGAVIIDGNFITAARVILPVSENKNINSRLGLRHRAAFGITEKTDAIAIVISEENGKTSFIKNGEIFNYKNNENLKAMIEAELV
ncbi:MAG: TIGR00159 family protein [Flavobacteriaceae bacterium]|nr:TIGR00159 family protein [Flavobacteriaceae bacterium]